MAHLEDPFETKYAARLCPGAIFAAGVLNDQTSGTAEPLKAGLRPRWRLSMGRELKRLHFGEKKVQMVQIE